jgi:copper chaperone CopZ
VRYYLIVLLLGFSAAVSAETIRATASGIICDFCATTIEKTFRAQPEVKAVTVDLEKKLVTITTKAGKTIDDGTVKTLIGNAGYFVVRIERSK